MPNPLMQQAQQLVAAQLAPVLAQTEAAYGRRTRQGRRFIRGLSKAFAAELGAIGSGVEGVYDTAERERAAMNAAMSQYMSGRGSQLAGELGQTLQAIDAPSQAPAQAQAALGASLGRQGMAMGQASLARLASEGTADEAYHTALPGIAALSAVQQGRDFENRMSAEEMATLAQINAQAPALTQDLFAALMQQRQGNRELNLRERELEMAREEALGGEGSRAARDRLDGLLGAAQNHIASMLPQLDPATGQQIGEHQPYDRLLSSAEAFLRLYLPNAEPGKIHQMARRVLASLNQIAPNRAPSMGGILAQEGALGRVGGAFTSPAASAPERFAPPLAGKLRALPAYR